MAVETEAYSEVLRCLPVAVSFLGDETVTGFRAFMAAVGAGEANKTKGHVLRGFALHG